MKVLLIGHSGTIGKAVLAMLRERGHEVVTAARSDGDVKVDTADHDSVVAMYEQVGEVDAVMVAAGSTPFKPLAEMSAADFAAGLQGKALSQIDVVLSGLTHVRPGGSFTLISGILAHTPVARGAASSAANGAVNSFVMAAAAELKDGMRINAISPTILTESLDTHGSSFPGFKPVPAEEVSMAYLRSLEGVQTGQIFHI